MLITAFYDPAAPGTAVLVAKDKPLPTDPLGTPGVARTIAAGATAGSAALTSTVTRCSILALGGAIRFSISGTAVATAPSHYIASGERLDIRVPAGTTISAIRVSADATLEVTELT